DSRHTYSSLDRSPFCQGLNFGSVSPELSIWKRSRGAPVADVERIGKGVVRVDQTAHRSQIWKRLSMAPDCRRALGSSSASMVQSVLIGRFWLDQTGRAAFDRPYAYHAALASNGRLIVAFISVHSSALRCSS